MKKEIRKDIPGLEGVYRVSNTGKVYSCRNNIELKLRTDLHGYKEAKFCMGGKHKIYRVNRLVYFSFNGGDLHYFNYNEKTLVCHINDIRDDNRLENLFLGTHQDNMDDMNSKGRGKMNKKFEYINRVKETILIRLLHKTGKYNYRELGEKFGYHRTLISRIINRKDRKNIF